jgi:hypothetical protein
MPKIMGATSTTYLGDVTHSKGDPQHYTLDFHKSPSVGENDESLTTRPSWLKKENKMMVLALPC